MFNNYLANFSSFFVERYRFTILLFIGVILLGGTAYTSLLQREGFPAVATPFATVQVFFAGETAAEISEAITEPIETALAEVEEVTQVSSITTDQSVFISTQFPEDVSSEEGTDIIRDQITNSVELPETAQISFQSFNAASIDGENDLIISLYDVTAGDSVPTIAEQQELEAKAAEIATELSNLAAVTNAEPISQLQEFVSPLTGESELRQLSFSRVGFTDSVADSVSNERNPGDLEFRSAISIGIQKQDKVGTIDISDAVRAEINSIAERGDLAGYEVAYTGDFAESLTEQISSLENNALSGLITIVIVLFLFVSWRAALVTALFMPAVMSATFMGLYLTGNTLNVISLFGLILVLGLFVDDAIVVVEAIDREKKSGHKGVAAVKAAIDKIGAADVSGTLTTILVFVPMLAISGILGEFIRLIPITVILALTVSLLIALTIFTYLSNLILITPKKAKENLLSRVLNAPGRFIEKLGDWSAAVVGSYLNYRVVGAVGAIAVSLVVLVAGTVIGSASGAGFDIFPSPKDSDEISVSISYPEDTEIDRAQEIAIDIETKINDLAISAEIETFDFLIGSANSVSGFVILTPFQERDVTAVEIADQITTEFENYSGATVNSAVSSAGPPSNDFPFQMQIFAEDTSDLELISSEVEQFIEQQEYTLTATDESFSAEEIVVENIDVVARRDGERFAEVRVKFTTEEVTSGDLIAVQESVSNEFTEDRLSDLGVANASVDFDQGVESDNQESFGSTLFALVVALIAMYVLLTFQFNSFSQPFLIFMALPFSLWGVLPGLAITNNPLSFFVMIGFIALAGIAVNNTIILIDYANQLRASGLGIRAAIQESVRVRFRPLVTTTVTTVAGLVPLAISDPFWEALSFTIIFGLIASTLSVIFFFPAYYAVVEKLRDYRNGFAARLSRS